MAGKAPVEKYVELIKIGPAKGLDASSSGDFMGPGDGVQVLNINTNRIQGAITNERGRTISTSGNVLLNGDPTITPTYSALYDVSATDHRLVVSTTSSIFNTTLVAFNPVTGASELKTSVAQPSGLGIAAFNQAVQFNGKMWLNSGFQYTEGNIASQLQQWQYPPWGLSIFGYNQPASNAFYPISGANAGGTLAAGTYFYAFTMVVTLPDGTQQETTPVGALPEPSFGANRPLQPYPFQATVVGLNSNLITITPNFTIPIVSATGPLTPPSNWGGSFSDGSTYTTNIYRQSLATPVWYLLQNVSAANATPVTDQAADLAIQGNQQLVLAQDPPPLNVVQNVPTSPAGASGWNSAQYLGAIFVHQERVWVFTDVLAQLPGPSGLPNSGTPGNVSNVQWQSQLWYSALGTPWQFDEVNQVLLVGNSATPQQAPGFLGYGDNPVAGISMGSLGVVFKSRSTWGLFGNDPSTFVVSRLFDIGCISRLSVISALGTVYWLSESGAFAFNGGAPQYLSQKIRNFLKAIPMSIQQTAISYFNDLTWYINFSGFGTLSYYTVTGDWYFNSNSASQIVSQLSNPNMPTNSFATSTSYPGEVLSLVSTPIVNGIKFSAQEWYSADTDLGLPITGTWQTPLTDSGQAESEKIYEYIVFMIPYLAASGNPQSGTVTGNLSIDPGSQPPKQFNFNFTVGATPGPGNLYPNQPQPRYILRLPPEFRGFQAQLTFSFTNTTTTNDPFFIESVGVYGYPDRRLVLPSGDAIINDLPGPVQVPFPMRPIPGVP